VVWPLHAPILEFEPLVVRRQLVHENLLNLRSRKGTIDPDFVSDPFKEQEVRDDVVGIVGISNDRPHLPTDGGLPLLRHLSRIERPCSEVEENHLIEATSSRHMGLPASNCDYLPVVKDR